MITAGVAGGGKNRCRWKLIYNNKNKKMCMDTLILIMMIMEIIMITIDMYHYIIHIKHIYHSH